MNPTDTEMILRMTGLRDVPSDIQREYEDRARMYHRSGATGALPPAMLVDMLRFLGYQPPRDAAPATSQDWRKLPQDGSVRVTARFYGQDMPGTFHGFVSNGTLAIKLEDDPFVKECRPDMVRFVSVSQPVAEVRDSERKTPEQLAIEQAEKLHTVVVPPLPEYEPEDVALTPPLTAKEKARIRAEKEAAKRHEQAVAKHEAEKAKSDKSKGKSKAKPKDEPKEDVVDETPTEERLAGFDPVHGELKHGDSVWVHLDDDVVDGVYHGESDGQLLILIEGETSAQKFSREHVSVA